MMRPVAIANYTTHQAGFKQLLAFDKAFDQEANILMFCGETGYGKSHLISYCLRTHTNSSYVHIDLHSEVWGIHNIYGALVDKVGWEAIPHFRQKVVQLVGGDEDASRDLSARQMKRLLKAIGQQRDLETRQDWYRQLTQAWFDDVESFAEPLLLVLDSYEHRSSELELWLRELFLAEAAEMEKMRIVIGGQVLPKPTADWEQKHRVYELKGVPEPEPWLSWATQIRIQDLTERTVVNLCEQMEGDPVKITQFLEIFPRVPEESETATADVLADAKHTRQIKKEKRKRLRQNMIERFRVNELYTVCFDLGINYETLPEYKELRGFVRELIVYAERNKMVAELVEECAEAFGDVVWEAYT